MKWGLNVLYYFSITLEIQVRVKVTNAVDALCSFSHRRVVCFLVNSDF